MQAHGWRAPWRWGVGVLAAIALVMLAGCGDSGSVSRSAAGVTGATSANETARSVEAEKKKKKKNDDEGDDQGGHKGRPEGEVQGQVANKSTGGCPTITFDVAGVHVKATGVTDYEGTSCAALQEGDFVKIEGQPLGNGTILAREVKKLVGPSPSEHHHAVGVTVMLVGADGASAGDAVTNDDGKFEMRNTAPGVYSLKAMLANGTTCASPLASDVELVAQKNRVKGSLEVAGGGDATCTNLVLEKLEVKNGKG